MIEIESALDKKHIPTPPDWATGRWEDQMRDHGSFQLKLSEEEIMGGASANGTSCLHNTAADTREQAREIYLRIQKKDFDKFLQI